MGNQLERFSLDVGWLIGIIEGEGCFCLNGKKMPQGGKSYYPTIQITNTNIAIIEKAKSVLGRLGLTCYIYMRVPKVGKPYYRIEVAGIKRVSKALEILLPLIECRQDQAALLAEYVALRLSKPAHSPLAQEEHELAKRLGILNGKQTRKSSTTTRQALARGDDIV